MKPAPGTRHPAPGTRHLAVVGLLLLGAALALVAPGAAHNNGATVPTIGSLADTDCTWQRANGSWPGLVGVRISDGTGRVHGEFNGHTRDFPAGVVRQGRVYSFINRIHAATNSWNAAVQSTDAGADGFDMGVIENNYSGGWTNNTITVHHFDAPAVPNDNQPGDGIGNNRPNNNRPTTFRTRDLRPGGDEECETEGGTDTQLMRINIYMPVYSHWHTAEERPLWEGCRRREDNGPDGYLCRKDRDFQSVVMHEMGHGLGMVHPDEATNGQNDGRFWAHCDRTTDFGQGFVPRARFTDRSIMCAGGQDFSTARRTISHLHDYDRQMLNHQMREQLP